VAADLGQNKKISRKANIFHMGRKIKVWVNLTAFEP
jgi:hypothetical protein